MPAKPGKSKAKGGKRGVDEGILTWASGPSTKHDYGGLEDKIDPWLMDCFKKCDERYPVLNQIIQVLHLMCIEDCRQQFMARQGSNK